MWLDSKPVIAAQNCNTSQVCVFVAFKAGKAGPRLVQTKFVRSLKEEAAMATHLRQASMPGLQKLKKYK